MPTITLSIHGGKNCNRYCRWDPEDGLYDLGNEDDHMSGVISDRAVIALDEYGHLAGVWQYDIRRYGGRTSSVLSCGTWVAPKYQRNGIAKKMWEFGLKHERPRRVSVVVITDRGYSLVHSVKEIFPKLKWKITEGGDRSLRKL